MKSICDRILSIHAEVRKHWPRLCRISIAMYDPHDDRLSTFADSTTGGRPLEHYSQQLANIPSLQMLAEGHESRIVSALERGYSMDTEHSQKLLASGYHSSYTIPMYRGEHFAGFLFFDADEEAYFQPAVTQYLGAYAELIIATITHEMVSIHTLIGAINTTRKFSRYRDEETGAHVQRVSHYAREIALGIADEQGLDDEYVEYLFQFAAIHDVGKIAIPDNILLKRSCLDAGEIRTIQTHVSKGLELIDVLIHEFELDTVGHIDLLRNIVAHHHERLNGTGYPAGLCGNEISLEGRIVAVADVFDALTSGRPYKSAWPMEQAFEHLNDNAGILFDARCVQAFLENKAGILKIRQKFAECRETDRGFSTRA